MSACIYVFLFLKCIHGCVGIYSSVGVSMWLLTPCRSLLLNRTVDVLWQVDYEPIIYAALLIKRKTAYYSSLARSLISATRFGCWRWSVIKKKRGSFMAECGKHQEITLWMTHTHPHAHTHTHTRTHTHTHTHTQYEEV